MKTKCFSLLIVRLLALLAPITPIIGQVVDCNFSNSLNIKVGEYIRFLSSQTNPLEFYNEEIAQQILAISIGEHLEFELAPGVDQKDALLGLTASEVEDYYHYCNNSVSSPLMMFSLGEEKTDRRNNQTKDLRQETQDGLDNNINQSSRYARGTFGQAIEKIPGQGRSITEQQAPRGALYRFGRALVQIVPFSFTRQLPEPVRQSVNRNHDIITRAHEAAIEWSKMKPFIESLVSRDRNPAVVDSYYRNQDLLYIQAEASWTNFFGASKKAVIEREVVKQFAELLAKERERLMTRQQSLGEILLEKYKENEDTISQIVNPVLVSGKALETDIDKLINGSLRRDHEVALNNLIALPDISFSGALGASYSILKLTLRKHAEIYKDALEESLQQIDQNIKFHSQEAQTHLKEAATVTKEVEQEELRLNSKHAPLTINFAEKIKPPIENNDTAWRNWAHNIALLCEMDEPTKNAWASYVVEVRVDKHETLSRIVKEAWCNRMKSTTDLLTNFRTLKEEELTLLQRYLHEKEEMELSLQETDGKYEQKLKESTQARKKLEHDYQQEVGVAKQLAENKGSPGKRMILENSLQEQQNKVANLLSKLEQAQEEELTYKETYQRTNTEYVVACYVSSSIAKVYKSREADYERKDRRLKHCIQADIDAWKKVWPECYFQALVDEANAAWEQAHNLSASAGQNWDQYVGQIEHAYEAAAQLAQKVVDACQESSEKEKWRKKANQALINATAARETGVAKIKTASVQASNKCDLFWHIANQFIQDSRQENLIAAETAGKETLAYIKAAAQLAQQRDLQSSFNNLHRAIEGATTFLFEDMFTFLGASFSGNLIRANQVLTGVEKANEAFTSTDAQYQNNADTIWASDFAWIADTSKRHLDFTNAHYQRAKQNSLWSWLREHQYF